MDREALEDPLGVGNYSVFHEMVARVHQDYGPEMFDALWAASAADPSTDGLLSAFETALGTTLFELMQRPSATCRDRFPGCVGLEQLALTANTLTVEVPRSCDDGTSGLEPGEIYRSFVLEIEQAGDLTVVFSGANGLVTLGACDGFDERHDYGFYSAAFSVEMYPVDAGLFRVYVMGNADGPASEVHFELTPTG